METFNNREQAVAHMANGGVISFVCNSLGSTAFRRINGRTHEASYDHGKTWVPMSSAHLSDRPRFYSAEKVVSAVITVAVGYKEAREHMAKGGTVRPNGSSFHYKSSAGRLMCRSTPDGPWVSSHSQDLDLPGWYWLEPIAPEQSRETSPQFVIPPVTVPYVKNGATYLQVLDHMREGGVAEFCGKNLQRRMADGEHQMRAAIGGVWTPWRPTPGDRMDKTRGAYVLLPIAKEPAKPGLLGAMQRSAVETVRAARDRGQTAPVSALTVVLQLLDVHFPRPEAKHELPLYIRHAVKVLEDAGKPGDAELLRMSAIKAGL